MKDTVAMSTPPNTLSPSDGQQGLDSESAATGNKFLRVGGLDASFSNSNAFCAGHLIEPQRPVVSRPASCR